MLGPLDITYALVESGKKKAGMPVDKVFILGMFAGVFVSLAGAGATIASATIQNPSLARLATAFVFPTGLIMIIFSGSQLFTGNCMIFISVLERQVTVKAMVKNWIIVYLGNLCGALLFVVLFVYGHTPDMMNYELANEFVSIAKTKIALHWSDALLRSVFCNVLVCMAIYVSMASTSAPGKIINLYMPVVVFVLCGFEHCVANMFYISVGLFCALEYGMSFEGLSISRFLLHNMIPVTVGNIIGGAIIISGGFWYAYIKKEEPIKSL